MQKKVYPAGLRSFLRNPISRHEAIVIDEFLADPEIKVTAPLRGHLRLK